MRIVLCQIIAFSKILVYTEKEIRPNTIVEMPETEISAPSATVAVSDKSMTQSQEDAQIHVHQDNTVETTTHLPSQSVVTEPDSASVFVTTDCTTQACSSNRKGNKKTTRKQTSKAKDSSDENCGICGKPEKSEEDWICCDICSIWYHRDFVGLEDETSWLTCSNPDAIYTCPMCV
ncbi:unnamed protein product [Mytilus edulis]|uniref:PHD-type domain-containing protein n=1 Tax=Mytilus edulis TaxID=6550 RepID=A0A8S3QRQ3_MYTED|nr:unnamed protein product [Mytilus edulis]